MTIPPIMGVEPHVALFNVSIQHGWLNKASQTQMSGRRLTMT